MIKMSLVVPTGQKVWSDLVFKDAIAKTKGTFDAINTNQASVIIAKRDAVSILGFIVGYAMSVTTDAENIPDLFVEVNSKALGISNEIIVCALGGNDGDANNESTPMRTKFIPFKIKPGFESKLFNASITFKAAPSVSNTGGLSVVVAVVYSNQEPDAIFWNELMAQKPGRVTGGDADGDAAKAHATAGGAVNLTALQIPSGTKTLRSLLGKFNINGITAAKVKSGFFEFIASGISDFSPQLWPLPIFWNAVLGTVADMPALSGEAEPWPTRFPLPGSEVTVQVQSTLVIAATTAPDTTQYVGYE